MMRRLIAEIEVVDDEVTVVLIDTEGATDDETFRVRLTGEPGYLQRAVFALADWLIENERKEAARELDGIAAAILRARGLA